MATPFRDEASGSPTDSRAEAPPVISASGLTKRFGRVTAVDDLSFEVAPGRVTGFLGPNGAGKTTTIRLLLGLARPTAGEARIEGLPYAELTAPTRSVGTLLDGVHAHPKRTARNHLRILARERETSDERVAEVLSIVDLAGAADRHVGGFSLGMRQRLGLAAALLSEPRLLILDEPANGLDPAGIRWLRSFLRGFAGRGGSVFISSHQLAEISQVADEVVVLNRGRFVTHRPVAALTAAHRTVVRTPDVKQLRRALRDVSVTEAEDGSLVVDGMDAPAVGELAASAGIVLHELRSHTESLEDVFLTLTRDEEAAP